MCRKTKIVLKALIEERRFSSYPTQCPEKQDKMQTRRLPQAIVVWHVNSRPPLIREHEGHLRTSVEDFNFEYTTGGSCYSKVLLPLNHVFYILLYLGREDRCFIGKDSSVF